jgi:hypothetical protein
MWKTTRVNPVVPKARSQAISVLRRHGSSDDLSQRIKEVLPRDEYAEGIMSALRKQDARKKNLSRKSKMPYSIIMVEYMYRNPCELR